MKFAARTSGVAVLTLSLVVQATPTGATPYCFYSFAVGSEKVPVEPCGGDAIRVGVNPRVLDVMRTFGIPKNTVTFKSCPGGRFAAMPDSSNEGRYVVQYPADVKSNYLSPIVHELAHVFQMRSAGGAEALRPMEDTRRIELGADFLAGLVFNLALGNLNRGDFETNIQLGGAYKLLRDDHGTPEHRTQAFRLGVVRSSPYPELTIAEALNYFNINDYARIRD